MAARRSRCRSKRWASASRNQGIGRIDRLVSRLIRICAGSRTSCVPCLLSAGGITQLTRRAPGFSVRSRWHRGHRFVRPPRGWALRSAKRNRRSHARQRDAVDSHNGNLSHVDCQRPQMLIPEERAILFVYCSAHCTSDTVSEWWEPSWPEHRRDFRGVSRAT